MDYSTQGLATGPLPYFVPWQALATWNSYLTLCFWLLALLCPLVLPSLPEKAETISKLFLGRAKLY